MTIFKGFVKPSSSSKNSRYEKFAQKEHKSEHATEDMSNCHTNKRKPSETRRHALFEGRRQRHAGIMCCVALSSQWIHPHGAPVLTRFTGQDPTPLSTPLALRSAYWYAPELAPAAQRETESRSGRPVMKHAGLSRVGAKPAGNSHLPRDGASAGLLLDGTRQNQGMVGRSASAFSKWTNNSRQVVSL